MNSVLCVDFDKVCSGLRKLDPAIANRFAPQTGQRFLPSEEKPARSVVDVGAPEGAKSASPHPPTPIAAAPIRACRRSHNLSGFEIIDRSGNGTHDSKPTMNHYVEPLRRRR